jgi:hypothetical protein
MDSELKQEGDPGVAIALHVAGAAVALLTVLIALIVLIYQSAEGQTEGRIEIAAAAVGGIVVGLLLMGAGMLVSDVHAMRIVAEHEARERNSVR